MKSPRLIGLLGILLFQYSSALTGQLSTAVFEYLSNENGLPQNHVFDVTQDSDGFMWFSTMGGLSKYDGFTFTNYFHREGDSTTLSSSYINAFYQDRKGRCWVITPNGFNRWNRRTGNATRYYHDPADTASLGHNYIRAILEDQEGYIWIAHQHGLDKFDPETNVFTHFFHADFSVARHSGALAMDSRGDIWAAGVAGIFKIDREKKVLQFVKGLPPSNKFPPFEGRDLFIDSRDRIWLAFKSGFARYLPETDDYEIISSDLFANGVMRIREYDENTLAIATGKGGLALYDVSARKIKSRYVHSPFDELSIRGNSIYSLYIDKARNIWLGLFYGISVTNLETERFRFIRNEPGFANYANFVLRVYKDHRGGIWSNTMTGLYYQKNEDEQGQEFIRPPLFPQGYKNLNSITGDQRGNVYFGFREVGLFKYNYDQDRIYQIEDDQRIDVSNLHYLHLDLLSDRHLWLCTSEGLYKFDLLTKEFDYYKPDSMHAALSSSLVMRVTQEPSGDLYFINSGKICRFDIQKSTIDTLSSTLRIEGTIYAIDISGRDLWIGSSKSIYHYNTSSAMCEKIRHQGEDIGSDGLTVDEKGIVWSVEKNMVTRVEDDSIRQYRSPVGFVTGIGSKSSDGQLVFGGDKGILLIDPEKFYVDTTYPDIVFTGIDVSNKKRILAEEAEYITQIQLNHDDKVFTLHYAPLHFIHREGLQYKYQLDGFDQDWVTAGTKRDVTYTNLRHGKYTFRAMAVNEDGLASGKPLAVNIIIRPPFTKTPLFYLMFALIMLGLLYVFYALRQKAFHLRKGKLLAEQQAAYQSLFLSNMSHEIRTPMNAIMGLNNLLLQTPLTAKQSEYAKAISVSCDNLLWIVNDILDQSKIESGTYTIDEKPFQLKAILHQLEILFTHLANEKNIRLVFTEHGDLEIPLVGDPVRLIQVLSNLLNNAIKFTDEGSITLVTNVQLQDNLHALCTFTITDTGIGIPEDKQSAIFESFQQVNEKVMAGNQGTGLGLSIVKYLVTKMKGDIRLRSVHGKGSEFVVTLPFKVNASASEIINGVEPVIHMKPGLRILLVEDAPLNQLVATELMKKWLDNPTIELAANGEDALVKIRQANFDLILMDVKMPVMDGLEATRRIRRMDGNYFKTIPIVGLTANVINQQVEECMKAGMNAFIAKPIRKEDFLEKIATQIPS